MPDDQGELFPLAGDTIKTKAEKTRDILNDLLKFRLDIERALEYGLNTHTFDDICLSVLEGRLHFYPLKNSFVIMEYKQYPQCAVYHTFLAGGDMDEIISVHPWMKERARAFGAKYCAISGRHGWVRALKDEGWKHQFSTMYLEV